MRLKSKTPSEKMVRTRCLALLVTIAAVRIEGYPALLSCERSIASGSEIMGAPTQFRPEAARVKLAMGGAEIECGGMIPAGETNLTFSWPNSILMDGGHFVIEAIASVGHGAWGIKGGTCGKTRAEDTDDESRYTAPYSGGAWMARPRCSTSKLWTRSTFGAPRDRP